MILTLALAASLLPSYTVALARPNPAVEPRSNEQNIPFKCELPPSVDPSSDGLPEARDIFTGEDALKLQVERHSAIVRVPTISYDDNGEPTEDPRWNIFYTLHDTLESLYPNV